MDTDRIMRYMNLFQGEVWRLTAREYPTLLTVTETVALTLGAGTVSAPPFGFVSVRDSTNGYNKLSPISLQALEDMDADLASTGNPCRYYMTSATAINGWPKNTTNLQVRYIPRKATLTIDSTEDDLKVPPEFHDMYVWGTMVYMSMDERDKAVSGEINVAQARYNMAMADYKTWLAEMQAGDELVTEAVLGG
jgi:hypothetical protein